MVTALPDTTLPRRIASSAARVAPQLNAACPRAFRGKARRQRDRPFDHRRPGRSIATSDLAKPSFS